MAEPFLDLGDVGIVGKSIGGGGRAQGMHAEAIDLGADAGFQAVLADNVAVDGGGFQRSIKFSGSVVLQRPEQRSVAVMAMAGSGR